MKQAKPRAGRKFPSKIPWEQRGDLICNGEGTICVLQNLDSFIKGAKEENGRLIVKAVNSYHKLLKDRRALRDELRYLQQRYADMRSYLP
jgi:hypothetical protein